jgi:hypothetical protein
MTLRFLAGVIASVDGAALSLVGQLGSMILAAIVGRFLLKSRLLILLIAFIGAFGAMVADIMYDGQGAFLLLAYAPVIYLVAVVGRRDLP